MREKGYSKREKIKGGWDEFILGNGKNMNNEC